ncbi:MAG: hypothetical protein V4478_03710 [Patescibacteria group bacterium]
MKNLLVFAIAMFLGVGAVAQTSAAKDSLRSDLFPKKQKQSFIQRLFNTDLKQAPAAAPEPVSYPIPIVIKMSFTPEQLMKGYSLSFSKKFAVTYSGLRFYFDPNPYGWDEYGN